MPSRNCRARVRELDTLSVTAATASVSPIENGGTISTCSVAEGAVA